MPANLDSARAVRAPNKAMERFEPLLAALRCGLPPSIEGCNWRGYLCRSCRQAGFWALLRAQLCVRPRRRAVPAHRQGPRAPFCSRDSKRKRDLDTRVGVAAVLTDKTEVLG